MEKDKAEWSEAFIKMAFTNYEVFVHKVLEFFRVFEKEEALSSIGHASVRPYFKSKEQSKPFWSKEFYKDRIITTRNLV